MSNHEILCKSANNKTIVYDSVNSHTATHFHDASGLREVVKEYLSKVNLDGEIIAKDIDMGKTIGKSDVVETNESDEIIYAMRKNREDQGYVPFTKSRPAQPSSMLSLHLMRKDEITYELSSAWIGEYDSPMFPQMDTATEESIPYWSSHAFVWGNQEIIPGTERSDCPW